MNALKSPSTLVKSAAAAIALALSAAAGATTALSNEYVVGASATNVGGNTWQFDYTVYNNNQGVGGQTGFDGFTIFVPTSATFVSATTPPPLNGAPGFWSQGFSAGLDLLGDGSQNLAAPSGYAAYTWWGQYTESVYTPGSTAAFSITLGNVSAGSNTVGLSTYYGYGQPTAQFASNQWGNYSTYTGSFASPLAAVPEPETYAMLLAGLGLVGFAARRRKAKTGAA